MDSQESQDDHDWKLHVLRLENFWRYLVLGAENGGRLFTLLVTSLVLLNGGALVAIVSIVTPQEMASRIAEAGLDHPLDTLFRLFAVSLITILASAAFGRFADDVGIRIHKPVEDAYPFDTTKDEKTAKWFLVFQVAAYLSGIASFGCFCAALTILMIKI